MQEIFYEESAEVQKSSESKKYLTFKILSIISFVCLGVLLLIYFFTLNTSVFSQGFVNILLILLPPLMLIASGVVFAVFKNKFDVAYDYTFVTGSIRISKVIHNIKRKSLFIFDTTDIYQIGKFGSDTYIKYAESPDIKKKYLTSNEKPLDGKDFYYILAYAKNEKFLMIIECTEQFMATVLKYSNKQILERDYK